MGNTFQYDVFLSFSGKDEERVKLLWSDLSSNGLKVFWSDKTLKESVGKSFFSVIQNALSESEHFLLCCTDNAMQSSWVKLEYETFFTEFHIKNKERLLILYHDNNFNRDNIPPFLKGLQTSTSLDEIIRLLGGADIKKLTQEIENFKKCVNRLTQENLLLKSEKETLISRYSILEYENNLLKNKINFIEK